MKTWYSIKASSASAEVSIHDEIGSWGVSAKDFLAQLRGIPSNLPINLSIHSPGGEVFDGWAIYNALKGRNVNVKIEGLAASMASVIAMAGTTRSMPENAYLMIHNPVGMAVGEAEDMRELADLLDKLRDGIAGAYMARTGLSREDVNTLMAAETWLDGNEALAMGFTTEVTDTLALSASAFDTRRISKMPTPSNNSETTEVPVTTEETISEPAVEETPAVEEKKDDEPATEGEAAPAPEAKGIIARAIAAFTNSKKSGELVASLRTEITAKDSEIAELKASLSSLKDKADIIAKLEAELVEAEKASKTASQKAAEIVAAAGFDPAKRGELPAVTDASTDRSMPRAEWQKLNHYEQARFFAEGGKLTD